MVINLNITLNNVNDQIDANHISETVESVVERITGFPTKTSIFDSDANTSPIMGYNSFRKIR